MSPLRPVPRRVRPGPDMARLSDFTEHVGRAIARMAIACVLVFDIYLAIELIILRGGH